MLSFINFLHFAGRFTAVPSPMVSTSLCVNLRS